MLIMGPPRELLLHLAEDAFDTLNWARRHGMKRNQQLEQVVEAFEKTLADAKTEIAFCAGQERKR